MAQVAISAQIACRTSQYPRLATLFEQRGQVCPANLDRFGFGSRSRTRRCRLRSAAKVNYNLPISSITELLALRSAKVPERYDGPGAHKRQGTAVLGR